MSIESVPNNQEQEELEPNNQETEKAPFKAEDTVGLKEAGFFTLENGKSIKMDTNMDVKVLEIEGETATVELDLGINTLKIKIPVDKLER